jgi:acetyltransferase-like isoleucine patch superfamily enzyme
MLKLLHAAGYLPGVIGAAARLKFLRRRALACGVGVKVLPGSFVGCPENLSIGDNSGIGFACYLGCAGGLTIGSRVLMGPYVMIYTTNHVWSERLGRYHGQGEKLAPVCIEDDVWLGAGCIILPGVTVARGTTVAAGAVVASDTLPQTVVGGVPAKKLIDVK